MLGRGQSRCHSQSALVPILARMEIMVTNGISTNSRETNYSLVMNAACGPTSWPLSASRCLE